MLVRGGKTLRTRKFKAQDYVRLGRILRMAGRTVSIAELAVTKNINYVNLTQPCPVPPGLEVRQRIMP